MTDQANAANGNVKQRAAIWVFAVFILGALLGSVSGYLFSERAHAESRMRPLSDDARRGQKVSLLTKELNLTPDQAKQLDDTIRDAQVKFKAIREASQPKIDDTRAQAREKVRAFLTPEQRPKYEAYLKQLDEDRRRNGQP
jgi:Spy/CpxP family protein refolding chaperone